MRRFVGRLNHAFQRDYARDCPEIAADRRRPGLRRTSAVAYDPAIEKINPGTMLVGYFQSPHYFDRVSDLLLKRLSARGHQLAPLTLHLRRGDYLNAPTAKFHGITSVDCCRCVRFLGALGAGGPAAVS